MINPIWLIDDWVKNKAKTNPRPFFPSFCAEQINYSLSETFLRLLELVEDGKLILGDYRDITGEEKKEFGVVDLDFKPYFKFSPEYLEWLNSKE